MGASPKDSRVRIQSLARGNAVLTVIAKDGVATLASIAKQTGLNKTTAFYILESLVGLGFVERKDPGQGYSLGLRNLELGKAVQRRLSIVDTATPALTKLCLATKETVNLAVPYLLDALIVVSLEGTRGVRVTSYAGTRAPYHATACGKVILAYIDEGSRQALYSACALDAITPSTVTSVAVLEAQLAEIRRVGHGFDLEEMEDGAQCVAAPIFDAFGKVAGSISVAGPTSRMPSDVRREIAALIKAQTQEISSQLGAGSRGSGSRGNIGMAQDGRVAAADPGG
jgi:DNA-binding IclR family transcriptional regulator